MKERQPDEEVKRKTYTKPQIRTYGDIRSLTQWRPLAMGMRDNSIDHPIGKWFRTGPWF